MPHEYIRIKKIYVKKGCGIEHACFQAPIGFTYSNQQTYINVDYVMDKECRS